MQSHGHDEFVLKTVYNISILMIITVHRSTIMVTKEVFYWRIQWAGRWMLTTRRFSEREIRQEHPEAIRVEDSRLTILTPETYQERLQASVAAARSSPDIEYRL